MTLCPKGDDGHDFPVEDDDGAYCEEHGVTLLWHGPPITAEDLAPSPDTPRAGSGRRAMPPSTPQHALGQHPH